MIARVIHIWNTAGIGGLLARYLDRYYDYESVAIARASHDPFSLATEKTEVWNMKAKPWVLRCLLKARNYDIIHVHSGIGWISPLKIIFPKKKVLIHLHGSKIRGRWNEYDLSEADMILVSTKDLLEDAPDNVLWLPNPIDEDLISKIKELNLKKEKGCAFHVCRFAIDKAKEYAEHYGLDLNLFNREQIPLYDHGFFLSHMARFEYYIDVKRGFPGHEKEEKKILEAMSLTGLEALSLGLKVIDWKGEIHEGLPHFHRSEKVAEILHGLYSWGWQKD